MTSPSAPTGTGTPSASTIITSALPHGRPSLVLARAGSSSAAVAVPIAYSLIPHTETTRESCSCTARLINEGGIGAPRR